jgi:hypothetical protein
MPSKRSFVAVRSTALPERIPTSAETLVLERFEARLELPVPPMNPSAVMVKGAEDAIVESLFRRTDTPVRHAQSPVSAQGQLCVETGACGLASVMRRISRVRRLVNLAGDSGTNPDRDVDSPVRRGMLW